MDSKAQYLVSGSKVKYATIGWGHSVPQTHLLTLPLFIAEFCKLIEDTRLIHQLSIVDLTFTHDGNKTYFDGLVNFEKMVSRV